METLYFENYEDLACLIGDNYDSIADKFGDVSVIGTYDEIKEIMKELVCLGYDIANIELQTEDSCGYAGEWTLSLDDEGIWCEKSIYANGYKLVSGDYVFVSNNCNSTLLKSISSDNVYAFEIEDDFDPEDDGECCCDCCKCKEQESPSVKSDVSSYKINGKPATKDEFEEKEKEFLKEYAEMMDEFNNRLAALNEIDKLIHSAFRW